MSGLACTKALVPVGGSHPGPCLLSHFPDKPKCINLQPPPPAPNYVLYDPIAFWGLLQLITCCLGCRTDDFWSFSQTWIISGSACSSCKLVCRGKNNPSTLSKQSNNFILCVENSICVFLLCHKSTYLLKPRLITFCFSSLVEWTCVVSDFLCFGSALHIY